MLGSSRASCVTMRSRSRRGSIGSASTSSRPRSTRLRTSRSSTSRCSRSDLGPDVLEERHPRGLVVGRPGRARIWASPMIVVIGVRSSWLMTSTKASRNAPARRSSSSSRSRSSRIRRRSVMSWPVPIIRIGRPSSSRKSRPAPWVQWIVPSGQTTRNSSSKVSCPSDSTVEPIALSNVAAVVWVDRVQIGGELRGRRTGLQPVLAEDRLRPGQRAGLDIPFPEAGPRRRQHQLEPCVAPFDLLGKGRHLVERIRQVGRVTRDATRRGGRSRPQSRCTAPAGTARRPARDSPLTKMTWLRTAAVTTAGDAACQSAHPGRQDRRGHQEDVERVRPDRLVDRSLRRDPEPADEDAGDDRLARFESDIARPRDLVLRPIRRSRARSRGAVCQDRSSSDRIRCGPEVWTTPRTPLARTPVPMGVATGVR